MPFENMPVSGNELGITSIDAAFVEWHKTEYKAAFIKRNPQKHMAKWRTLRVPVSLFDELSIKALTELAREATGPTGELPAMPASIHALARFAASHATKPAFEIEYFDKDPILHVFHGPTGHRERTTLGIWDTNSRIIAIATHPAATVPPGLFARVMTWMTGAPYTRADHSGN